MSLEPISSWRSLSLRDGLLESLTDISIWIGYCTRSHRYRGSWQDDLRDDVTFNELDLDATFFSDVLRLLLIDAATTDDESQRTRRLSTLLLLTNHPGVGLQDFMGNSMDCCHYEVGIAALVKKTTAVFIYLNLLLAFAEDDQQGELLRPCHSLEEWPPTSSGRNSIMRLMPRPAYMNTRSFTRVLEYAVDEHAHAVEHVFFNPIFAPRSSGCRSKWLTVDNSTFEKVPNDEPRFERDVMADRESLGEALKQMWRVLFFCDMVLCEANDPVNWENASLEAIFLPFRDKGIGKVVREIEREREEEGYYNFWANPIKNTYDTSP